MDTCAYCGGDYDSGDGQWAVCGGCWDQLVSEADESDDFDEFKRFLRWLYSGVRYADDSRLIQIMADSHAGAVLMEGCLVVMDYKCLMNLLERVHQQRS